MLARELSDAHSANIPAKAKAYMVDECAKIAKEEEEWKLISHSFLYTQNTASSPAWIKVKLQKKT